MKVFPSFFIWYLSRSYSLNFLPPTTPQCDIYKNECILYRLFKYYEKILAFESMLTRQLNFTVFNKFVSLSLSLSLLVCICVPDSIFVKILFFHNLFNKYFNDKYIILVISTLCCCFSFLLHLCAFYKKNIYVPTIQF